MDQRPCGDEHARGDWYRRCLHTNFLGGCARFGHFDADVFSTSLVFVVLAVHCLGNCRDSSVCLLIEPQINYSATTLVPTHRNHDVRPLLALGLARRNRPISFLYIGRFLAKPDSLISLVRLMAVSVDLLSKLGGCFANHCRRSR